MTLEQLRYFVAVANCHSVSIVAEQMYVSRQNISKSIKNLEEEVKVKVFFRSNQGVFLTPNGQQLYNYAKEILQKYDEMLMFASHDEDINSMLHGRISFLFVGSFLELVYDSVNYYLEHYPNVKVHLKSINQPPSINEINASADSIYGLSLLENNVQSFIRGCSTHECYYVKEESLKVLVSKQHVLANQKSRALKTLSRYPGIFFNDTLDEASVMHALFYQRGYKPNVYMITNTCEVALHYVGDNKAYCFGSNFMPRATLNYVNNHIRMIPLNEVATIIHFILIPRAIDNEEVNTCGAFFNILNERFSLKHIHKL